MMCIHKDPELTSEKILDEQNKKKNPKNGFRIVIFIL